MLKIIIKMIQIALMLAFIPAISFATISNTSEQDWRGARVYSMSNSMGSGVPVSNCHVLTNEHVVRGGQWAEVRIQNESYTAEVVAIEDENDMALLKIEECPIINYAKVSPNPPEAGEMLFSVYYKPGFNFFRRMIKTHGEFIGHQPILTEENKSMISMVIDDPRPYYRSSGGGVSNQEGLVSVIFGIAPRCSKSTTYAVSYDALKRFLQENQLFYPHSSPINLSKRLM